jgi:hypothetical protein
MEWLSIRAIMGVIGPHVQSHVEPSPYIDGKSALYELSMFFLYELINFNQDAKGR